MPRKTKAGELFCLMAEQAENGVFQDKRVGLVSRVASDMDVSEQTARKYLKELEDCALVKLLYGATAQYGGRGQLPVIEAKLLADEFPEPEERPEKKTVRKRRKPRKKKASKRASRPKTLPKTFVPSGNQPLVAVVVDYDNAAICARDNGFVLSFKRLAKLTRKFGRVILKEVFVSTRSKHWEVDTLLKDGDYGHIGEAGFAVVVCPLDVKGNDTVDARLRAKVRFLAEFSHADTIVVVSEDADIVRNPELISFVEDLGKNFELVNTVLNRDSLEARGDTMINDLEETDEGNILGRAIRAVSFSEPILDPETERAVELVIDAIRHIEKCPERYPSFMHLKDWVWDGTFDGERQKHDINQFGAGLSAHSIVQEFVDRSVLLRQKKPRSDYSFYVLNGEHPAVQKALQKIK